LLEQRLIDLHKKNPEELQKNRLRLLEDKLRLKLRLKLKPKGKEEKLPKWK
jgi:hypothetical protein